MPKSKQVFYIIVIILVILGLAIFLSYTQNVHPQGQKNAPQNKSMANRTSEGNQNITEINKQNISELTKNKDFWMAWYKSSNLGNNGKSLAIAGGLLSIFGNAPSKSPKISHAFVLTVNSKDGNVTDYLFFNINNTTLLPGKGLINKGGYMFITCGVKSNNTSMFLTKISDGSYSTTKIDFGIPIYTQSVECELGTCYVTLGTNEGSILLMKIKRDGSIIWIKEYTAPWEVVPMNTYIEDDSVYVTWAHIGKNVTSGLLVLDKEGDIKWATQYLNRQVPVVIIQCTEFEDNIQCVGSTGKHGEYRPLIVTLNKDNGSIINSIELNGLTSANIKMILKCSDNTLFLGESFNAVIHPIKPYVTTKINNTWIAYEYIITKNQTELSSRLSDAICVNNTMYILAEEWNSTTNEVWSTIIKTNKYGQIPGNKYVKRYILKPENISIASSNINFKVNDKKISISTGIKTTKIEEKIKVVYVT